MREPHIQRIGNGILAALVLLLLFAVWEVYLRVEQGIEERRQEITRVGQRLVEALDQEVDIHRHDLMAMELLAQRFLEKRTLGAENPVVRLRPAYGHDGYYSVVPTEFGALDTLGRLVGGGKVPSAHDPVAEEMVMAVGLTPIMRAIRTRSPYTPWVYYTSQSGFMFLFPASEAQDFFFKPELMKMDFLVAAGPQSNPGREVFWSQAYEDEAGKGLLTTVSKPLYRGDDFMGSLSIDLSVNRFQNALANYALPDANLLLYEAGDGHQLLASTGAPDSPETAIRWDTVVLPIHQAPWKLEIRMDHDSLVRGALRSRAVHIATVGVFALTLLFLMLLTRSARQMREMSIRDGLTGLYNRRHFDEVAGRQFDGARRAGLRQLMILADIDYFKKYNDSYGHQQGDVALRSVAKALQAVLRRGSDQVFRVGGEEFAALVQLQPDEAIAPLLEKLNQAVRDLALPHGQSPMGTVSISVGATVLGQPDWLSVDRAYKQADNALYQAKAQGRDRAVCLPALAG